MPDHRVPSLKAALDLAESWRAAGTHTWFRGQNRLWPIVSALGRRRTDQVAEFRSRLRHFCEWLADVPELRYLLEGQHVHSFFAVLQHYGVPTHYVDFSVNPKVAAFFAGVGPDATPGEEGCIIAIEPDDWLERLRTVAEAVRWPDNAWPEKVEVKVPNLWRMEAQSGYFLYLPVERPEGYSPVDRIVFPHDGSGIELAEEEIYPSRKSSLEVRLDEFFTEELMRSNQKALLQMARAFSAGGRGVLVEYLRPESGKGLRPGEGAHPSWASIPAGWSDYVHEQLSDVRDGSAAQLRIDTAAPLAQREELRMTVRRLLSEDPGARRKAIGWKVAPLSSETPRGWTAFVERAGIRVWDGMRRLPFTDDQLADSVAMTVILACANVSETPLFSVPDFARLLGPVLQMQLANARDVTARAAMAKATYASALRPDLEDVVVPELLGRPREELRQVLAPPHLFEFDSLVEAFASELIPTQVLIQGEDRAVFFSPVRTPVIGAP
jgi:hypothetical protein